MKTRLHEFWVQHSMATAEITGQIENKNRTRSKCGLLEVIFEIFIVFVEAIVLYIIYLQRFSKFLFLSFVINLFSYGIGLLIYIPYFY